MKAIITAVLALCVILFAETTTKKAIVTTVDGSTQEVIVVEESMDSLKIKVLDAVISMPKSKIKSITYPENRVTLEKMDQKLDTMITLQRTHIEDQMYNPLKTKNYGIEMSVLGLLTLGQDYGYMAGGFSIFNLDRSAEIIIPLTYSWSDTEDNSFVTSVQYRKFLGFFDNVQNGLYISALLSYARVHRTAYDYVYNYNTQVGVNKKIVSNKNTLGFGFGIGYRRFSKSGWYWGTGLVVGRYFDEDNYNYTSPFGGLYGGGFMLDFELLKFGWAF